MVTATISVMLGDRQVFSMTAAYSGSQDPEWENEMALAAQRSMQKALEGVEIPPSAVGGVSKDTVRKDDE